MKTKKIHPVPLIVSIIGLLYLALMVVEYFVGENSFSDPLTISIAAFLLIYIVASIIIWKNMKLGAYLLMLWNLSMWILGLYIDRSGGGIIIFFAYPVLILAVLALLQWYKGIREGITTEMEWRFALKALLLNYAPLYVLYVVQDVLYNDISDILSYPWFLILVLLIMLVVFFVGFIIAWKNIFWAGIIFIFWYILVVVASIFIKDFFNSGPHIITGLCILFQGIFYLKVHFSYKNKKPHVAPE